MRLGVRGFGRVGHRRAQGFPQPLNLEAVARSWAVGAEYAMLCAIWGSTWLVILLGMAGVSPFLGASLRFVVAVAVLLAIAAVRRRPFPHGRTELGLVAFVGVVLFGADYGLIYWGEANGVPSGLSAVLFATLPLQTALIAHVLIPSERLTVPKIVGIFAGLAGLVLIFRGQLAVVGAAIVFPMAAIVLSSTCAAASSVAVKRWGHGVDPVTFNLEAMAIGAVVLGAASVVSGEPQAWPAWPAGVLSILYLAVFGSVITFVVYLSLLKRIEVSAMSFIAMITPIVALVLGFVVLGETVETLAILGTVLTLAGVYVSTQVGRARRPSVVAPESAVTGDGPVDRE